MKKSLMIDKEFRTEITTSLNEKFYRMEKVWRVLTTAYNLNEKFPMRHNVILSGRGGFGKSEGVKAFLELTNEKPFVVAGYKQMGPEQLNGGVDWESWMKNSAFTMNFVKSLWNHKIVIIEEGLDLNEDTMASMREHITSLIFSAGQHQPIATKMIVICTNVEPEDISGSSQSLEALMQRFPHRLKVDWSHLNETEQLQGYALLSKRELEDSIPDTFLYRVVNKLSGTSLQMQYSPRQCIQLAQTVATCYQMEENTIAAVAEAFESFGIQDAEYDNYQRRIAEAKVSAELQSITQGIERMKHNLSIKGASEATLKAGMQYVQDVQKSLTQVITENATFTQKTTDDYATAYLLFDNTKKHIKELGAEIMFKDVN